MLRLRKVMTIGGIFCVMTNMYMIWVDVLTLRLQRSPFITDCIIYKEEQRIDRSKGRNFDPHSASSTILSFGNTTHFRLNYLLNNPSICSAVDNLTFVVTVHTATDNFNERLGIRQTWANASHYSSFSLRTIFFVGRPEDKRLQGLLEEENRQFKDIVQGDFLDTYRNITYKGVMVYHWISVFCMHAQVILKVDDDVFVNMFRIVQQHLPVLRKHPRQIFCDVVKHGPVRREMWYKWAVKPDEIPASIKEYPTYCRGYIVLMTPDLIVPMLEKIPSNPFFWIDDVYLFGLLPAQLGVRWYNIVPRTLQVFEDCLRAYQREIKTIYQPVDVCFDIPGRRGMVSIWNTVLRDLPEIWDN